MRLSALLLYGKSLRAWADLRLSTEARGQQMGIQALDCSPVFWQGRNSKRGRNLNRPGCGQRAQNGAGTQLSWKMVSNTMHCANCLSLGQHTFPKSSSNSGNHSCIRVSMSGIGLPGKKRHELQDHTELKRLPTARQL